jgi:hypothetical protein
VVSFKVYVSRSINVGKHSYQVEDLDKVSRPFISLYIARYESLYSSFTFTEYHYSTDQNPPY